MSNFFYYVNYYNNLFYFKIIVNKFNNYIVIYKNVIVIQNNIYKQKK